MASSLVHCFEAAPGQHYLSIIVKRAYAIRPGGRAEPTRDWPSIRVEPEFAESKSAPEIERLVHDSDLFAPGKPLTDVLLSGSAHARDRVGCVETGLQVGRARKAVRVFGDRRVVRSSNGVLGFSTPEPFVRMPIHWDLAYGGRDLTAEAAAVRELAEPFAALGIAAGPDDELPMLAYPRNPAGRGYFVGKDLERLIGTLAPNLDDPSDPVEAGRLMAPDPMAWLDLPTAACYEPIDPMTFPRSAFSVQPAFSPPRRPVHELALGGLLPEDLRERDLWAPPHARCNNAAPAGLAVCRLEGGERVQLWNLHGAYQLLEFDLPGDRPELVLEPPGVAPRRLAPLLQTVLIEPDRDRVTLTWTGSLPVAMPYPDEMTASMRHGVNWSR